MYGGGELSSYSLTSSYQSHFLRDANGAAISREPLRTVDSWARQRELNCSALLSWRRVITMLSRRSTHWAEGWLTSRTRSPM